MCLQYMASVVHSNILANQLKLRKKVFSMLQIRSPIYIKTIYISNKTLNKKTKHNKYLAQMSAIYSILIGSMRTSIKLMVKKQDAV